MAVKFEVFIDHYTLQWLESVRMGSVLLQCWLPALENYDFTIWHWPGHSQSHINGLSCFLVDPLLLADTTVFYIPSLPDEEAAQEVALELHNMTHIEREALWKLFKDRFTFPAGKWTCMEVARYCIVWNQRQLQWAKEDIWDYHLGGTLGYPLYGYQWPSFPVNSICRLLLQEHNSDLYERSHCYATLCWTMWYLILEFRDASLPTEVENLLRYGLNFQELLEFKIYLRPLTIQRGVLLMRKASGQ